MKIFADGISKGSGGIPLPMTSVQYESGRVSVAEAEVGDHPTVLALVLSGRMVPDTGTVLIDGADDPGLLAERVALVDAPDVSEPAADLSLRAVVKEELMFAGRSTSRDAVARTIAEAVSLTGGLEPGIDWARVRIADVPAALRIRLLAELASFRRGVQGLVLASPDRHGGDPRDWYAIAEELARRDFAVAVVCGRASTLVLEPLLTDPLRIDAVPAAAAAAAPPAPTAPSAASPAPAPTAPALPETLQLTKELDA